MNKYTPLSGRTAIVTGAGGGIGRGLALALAEAGAHVVIAARRAVTGDETLALVRQEGGSAISVQADVGVRADIDRAVAAAIESSGRLDIVVHNASSGQSGTPTKLEEIDDARWDEQYATALDASFYLAQASFQHLKRGGHGRFIILSSSQALHGGAMNPIYVAVKSAQRGMVKGLAREWGPHGIVVNGIAPASETETSKAYFEKYPQVRDAVLGNIALRRLGNPRIDIGGAIVALCSDQMQYVTGQVIPVDGGGYTAL